MWKIFSLKLYLYAYSDHKMVPLYLPSLCSSIQWDSNWDVLHQSDNSQLTLSLTPYVVRRSLMKKKTSIGLEVAKVFKITKIVFTSSWCLTLWPRIYQNGERKGHKFMTWKVTLPIMRVCNNVKMMKCDTATQILHFLLVSQCGI